ncbi:MAG: hypothetical protein SGARI_001082, partial [Bacillariaceae sp.]
MVPSPTTRSRGSSPTRSSQRNAVARSGVAASSKAATASSKKSGKKASGGKKSAPKKAGPKKAPPPKKAAVEEEVVTVNNGATEPAEAEAVVNNGPVEAEAAVNNGAVEAEAAAETVDDCYDKMPPAQPTSEAADDETNAEQIFDAALASASLDGYESSDFGKAAAVAAAVAAGALVAAPPIDLSANLPALDYSSYATGEAVEEIMHRMFLDICKQIPFSIRHDMDEFKFGGNDGT